MLQILTVTGPIYLIIAAGCIAVRQGLFEKADTRVLGRFVVDFCMPALLPGAVAAHDRRDRRPAICSPPSAVRCCCSSAAPRSRGACAASRCRSRRCTGWGCTAAVVFACMPMLSGYPRLAQQYSATSFSAAMLLATTVVSFPTISGWLAVLDAWLHWNV